MIFRKKKVIHAHSVTKINSFVDLMSRYLIKNWRFILLWNFYILIAAEKQALKNYLCLKINYSRLNCYQYQILIMTDEWDILHALTLTSPNIICKSSDEVVKPRW